MSEKVGSYMAKGPYVGHGEWSLQKALELMRSCRIRHLPISVNERLVGLVSERDIYAAQAKSERTNILVQDVMKKDLLVFEKSSPLKDVVRAMQIEKTGSALVVDAKNECVGIFTTTDALRVLGDLLEETREDGQLLYLKDFTDYWSIPQTVLI